jgi:glutaminase
VNAFDALSAEQLEAWVTQARHQTQAGTLPRYIPALGTANPDGLAVHMATVQGRHWSAGDRHLSFALMSVIKPFVVLYACDQLGLDAVQRLVGVQPSDYPYNSLTQLERDRGFPRNPMLNSGAITLCSALPGNTPSDRGQGLCQWLNAQAQTTLALDMAMLKSVRDRPNDRNQAIAHYLDMTDHLVSSAQDALDVYEQVCCLAGTVQDLAQLGLLLVSDSIAPPHRQRVTALMLTCGLYEYSSTFAVEVGIPAKSGVSGAVLAIVPRQGAIACYSPPLDAIGNSAAGLWLLRQIATSLRLSLFG